ncbi:MAG: SufS family cysteine desulfurase [Candidatus Levybacteria bacterium]|nr:SufS family cysteine desulfurase [Candidatus Levybacteria bacterium]
MRNYKKDFPIFRKKRNGKPLVYLDSAATSQKPQVVIDAVSEFYESYNSNIHRGIYAIAEKATERVEEVRKKVAQFINAKNEKEIVFTHGATEGINILASSLRKTFSKNRGVLLTEMEHHSNIIPWQHYTTQQNAPLDFLEIDRSGIVTEKVMAGRNINKSLSTNNYSVISIAHVSNVLGSINSIEKIRNKFVTKRKDTVLVIDAAQSVPHMKVDVQDSAGDFLVFSGHKMLAPTGVGVIWGRENVLNTIDPLLYGSQMIKEVTLSQSSLQNVPEKLEPGTLPLEGIIGLGAAIDYLNAIGMGTIRTHEKRLTEYLLERLCAISGVIVFGPLDLTVRSGVISFSLAGIHAHDVAQVLAESNICVRAGHHCALPLHKKLGVPASVRVSLNIYNDEEDIEAFLKGILDVKRVFSVR